MIAALFLAVIPLWLLPVLMGFFLPPKQASLGTRWWLGLITTGVILILCHGLRLPLEIITSLVVCLSFLPLLIPDKRQQIASSFDYRKFNAREILPLLLLIPLIGAAYIHVLANPVSPEHWDAISIWLLKTKLLYRNLPLEQGPIAIWGPYINYPHLGPALEAWIIRILPHFEETYGRLLFPSLYVSWILALRAFKPRQKSWLYSLLLVLIAFIFFDMDSLTSGYQDGFVMMICGMSALHFILLIENKDGKSGEHACAAYFFAGCAGLVKSEGAILSLILVLAANLIIFLSPQKKDGKPANQFRYAALYLFLLLLWPCILAVNHIPLERIQNQNFSTAGILGMFRATDRWGIIFPYFVRHFSDHFLILLTGLLSLLSLWITLPACRRALIFLLTVWTGHLLFIFLPYLASQANVVWHLENSFSRLMYQHGFLYPTVIAYASAHLLSLSFKE